MIRLMVIVIAGALIGAALGYFGKCTSGACPFTANPFRGAFFGALAGLLFGFASGGMRNTVPTAADAKASDAIIRLKDAASLDAFLATSSIPVVVDFYADWCGPCRRLGPELSAVAEQWQGKAAVIKVNVDRHRDLAGRFKVRSIPDVRFYKNGQERQKVIGYRNRDALSEILESLTDAPVDP